MAKSTVAVSSTTATTAVSFGDAFNNFFNEESVVVTPSVESKTIAISSGVKKATGIAAVFAGGIALGTAF